MIFRLGTISRRTSQVRLIVLIIAAVLGGRFAARADEYDTLRLKWLDNLTMGTNANPSDPSYSGWISSIGSVAQNNWNSMRTNATRAYLWNDFDQLGANSADLTATYERLRAMAMGYAVRGSTLEANGDLRGAIINGLDWMYTNYYNEAVTNEYDNWYDWEIGAPLNLNDITVLLYENLTAAQVAKYMNAVDHFTPTPDLTAANEVWKATVVAVRGVIVKDTAKLAAARQSLSDVFPYVTSGDGFYLDGSFVFHSIFPYNGGYGAQLIETIGPLMQLLKGSSWAVTDAMQANLYHWIHDSFEPFIYQGAFMPMVQGRYFTRRGDDHLDGEGVIASILRLTQFAPPTDAAAIKSLVKSWLVDDTYRNFVQTQPPPFNVWAKDVINDNGVAPLGELAGHHQFPHMDRVVHLRPGWGFGLAMSSSRIGNYESIQGENLRGWYTGDGMTYLYNADLTHYADNFWQTVNAYRLPGTTVDSQTRTNSSGEGYLSPNNWVGGASVQNLYGVAGMQLNAWNSTLSARKSWFMFDEEIVCLGAGIISVDNRTVETIVENRRLSAFGNNVFAVNGAAKPTSVGWSDTMTNISYAHLAGTVPGADIGYFFPQGATLKALREARTGSLYDLNTAYGSKSQSLRNYLTLWFDHGANPSNATYSYVLLPNKSAAQVAAYAASSNLVVLGNSTRAQGVRKISLGLTAVNFWTDGTNGLGGLTVNKKSSVIVRNDGTFLEVGLADPTQTNTGSISLEISSAASALISADPAVRVVQMSPTIKLAINVNGAGGESRHARFFVGPPCTYSISPTNRAHGYGVTTNSVSVTTASGCAWTVINTNSWISILPPTSGLGSGTVSYAVDANFSVTGRTGVVMIADQVLTLSQQPTTCSYSISPTNRVHGYGVTTNSVSVTTASGCAWTVVNTNNWINILSGASGTGGGIMTYTVGANPSPVDRTGLVAIADQTFTILQRAVVCAYDIAPTNRVHGYAAASNTVSLTTSGGCAWTVINTNSWITILPPTNGLGAGSVSYAVDANFSVTGRTGVVMIADQVLTLSQQPTLCTYTISPTNRVHGYGVATNSVSLTTANGCAWTVVNTNSWIKILSGASGTGGGIVMYTVDANPSPVDRTGLVAIADQSFTILQRPGVCAYDIAPANRVHGFGAASNAVSLTTKSGCTWTVVNTNDWITITSPTSGSASTIVSYTVASNLNPTDRAGMVMIAGQVFTLSQRGFTNSPFAFRATTSTAGGQLKLTLMGIPTGVWVVQRSPDLIQWQKVSNLTNTSGIVEFTDTVPIDANPRFYRAVLPP